MIWKICFAVSVAIFALSIVLAFFAGTSKKRRFAVFDSSRLMFIGVVVSSSVLFVPIYNSLFHDGDCGFFETLLISVHNMIRLFVVDGDYTFITDNISEIANEPGLARAYTVFFSVLFLAAPILTFSFVLSFFKNIRSYRKFVFNFKNDTYIFSELNERSIVLAESIIEEKAKENKKCCIVFTDVFEGDNETSFELCEKARELGAVCFKKDIAAINFNFHSKKSELYFFTIGEDESENVNQALKLTKAYGSREKTNLYVFSSNMSAELILSSVYDLIGSKQSEFKMKIRRINEIRSLIIQTLFKDGYEKIFKSAYDDGKTKNISAIVIGMGKHGTEMTKALSWLCQMDGYHAEIDSFDIDENAAERFNAMCPELMDSEHNGKFDDDGEAQYRITVHAGVDVDTKHFESIAENLHATYILVALGDDDRNIAVAVKMRSLFLRCGLMPVIQAVVYNTDKCLALKKIKSFNGKEYMIDFIGDMKSSYSQEVIMHSKIEEMALQRHLVYDNSEESFWNYDYNYNSSAASAVHHAVVLECKIPEADIAPEKRSNQQLWALRKQEHRRWNAYMRSIGYVYGGSIDREKGRNDIAKMHNFLVPFDELPLKEQEKDDV